MIAGGLYSVTALREDDQERVTVYTKHRRTLQAQVTEALGSQDTRRDGGREGEVVLHGGGNAVAAKGVLGDLNPLGDSPCRILADGGACVPKILPTAELEGFLTGLIVAMPPEPGGGAGFLRLPNKKNNIVGGLYSVTALRENDHERVTVYTKHRLTLQALVTEALGS